MSDEFQSGRVKVDNLSNGVFRSRTPNTIPSGSWSDISNCDFDNSALITRRGIERYSTTGHKPGCLQFGFSDTQRCHYLKSSGGDYGPSYPSDTYWNAFVYARDFTATTGERALVTFVNSTNEALAKLYWDDDDYIHFDFRQNSNASTTWHKLTGSSGTKRATITDYIFGVGLYISGTTSTTVIMSVYDSGGSAGSSTVNVATTGWMSYDGIILGCDSNLSYPESDWTATTNWALYGLMGELCITRDVNPTATTLSENYAVVPPGYFTASANRIAYYPLRNDYEDEWGSQPDFNPVDMYRTGAGNIDFFVQDSVNTNAKNLWYSNKSWRVNTFNESRHLYLQNTSVATTYQNDFIASNASYAMTFGLYVAKTESGTSNYPLFTSGNYGPKLQISRVNEQTSRINFTHRWYSGVTATTSMTITADIPNKRSNIITCEYSKAAITNTTVNMRIFRNLGLVASTLVTGVNTLAVTATTWTLGVSNVSNIGVDFYLGPMLFHDTVVGTSWGDKPAENVGEITTSYTTPLEFSWYIHSGSTTIHQITTGGETITDTQRFRVDPQKKRVVNSLFDLPKYSKVFAAYLLNETTGFDVATTLTPHGVIQNAKGNRIDNTDLKIYGNTSPAWIADRGDLTSTNWLGDVYDQDVDNILPYAPNDGGTSEILMLRNVSLTNNTGTTHQFSDTYHYTQRTDGKLRGFMYGLDIYLHNNDYFVRYDGQNMVPVECPTPSIPLTLTPDNTPGAGLNGLYGYSYAFLGKNGMESYPSLPVFTTVSTGTVAISCGLQVYDESWLDKTVESVIFYRTRGTTTASTLSLNAGEVLLELKQLPLKTIKDNRGGTWFTDDTGDDFLREKNPPSANMSDYIPPCKYSCLYNQSAYYTGNSRAPDYIYKAFPEQPFHYDIADEFRTRDGEDCTAIASLGCGVIAFKETARRYYSGGIGQGNRIMTYENEGCISHDSIANIENEIIGLSENGFFICNGNEYRDITTIIDSGRAVTSLQYELDTEVSRANKQAASAVYHHPTSRYLCKVGTNVYVFHTKRKYWTVYRGVVGKMIVFGSSLYMYVKGRLYKEVSGDSTVGDTAFSGTITSGGTGFIIVTSTTALPTSNEEGLPCYVDNTLYWVFNIDSLGSNQYKVWLNSNANFSTSTNYGLGAFLWYADTKFFEERTPGRNKLFCDKLVVEHSNTANGEINVRIARNNGSFDTSWAHFTADTDIAKIQTILRVRAESMALRFEGVDGKEHVIRNYSFPYIQESIE